MLLDNLLEPGVIELRELCKIMHIGDDIAQILLQELKVLFGRTLARLGSILIHGVRRGTLSPRWWSRIKFLHDILDLFLGHFDTADDLAGLDLLESEDFLKLCLKDFNERLFVVFGPFLGRRNGGVGARRIET